MKRVPILALVLVGFLTAAGQAADNGRATTSTTSTTVATTRAATADEASFCLAHLETLGPITGDCNVVPLGGELFEDDPWGRWDCRTMGNHICGDLIFFNIGGELHAYDLNAPDRPGCFMEPSNRRQGWEIIFYSRISGRGAPEYIGDPLGFEVGCPA